MLCGIDFGTRNTAIVKGQRRVVGSDNSTVPSFVAYSRTGLPRRIGNAAKVLLDNPGEFADWDVRRSFKLQLPESDGSPNCIATSVTADFLGDVLRLQSAGPTPVTGAVMAIPVAWPSAARRALRVAAGRAGIDLKGFVSESTAAFAWYRTQFGELKEVAVFDWGAGTLDISVLRIRGGSHGTASIEELHCASSDSAGDVVDGLLAQRIHKELQRMDHALPPWTEIDRDEQTRLCHQAEWVKIALSDSTIVSMPISLNKYCGKPRVVTISSKEFEDVIRTVIEGALDVLFAALLRAGTSAPRLDAVLVVGGCSKLRGFGGLMREQFGSRLAISPDSEWAVAEGAQQIAEAGDGCYACVQEFCLVLSDGLALPLTAPRAPFDGRSTTHVVGKIDSANVASLVFGERAQGTSGDPRTIGGLAIPSQGLPGEPIEVSATLDPDLFLRIRAGTLLGNDRDVRTFEYPSTRFEYHL